MTPWHNACDVHGLVLRTSYNLPVLYSYFNEFCISDVQHFELTLVSCSYTNPKFIQADFVLINVHLFDTLSAISSGKVSDFFLSGEW